MEAVGIEPTSRDDYPRSVYERIRRFSADGGLETFGLRQAACFLDKQSTVSPACPALVVNLAGYEGYLAGSARRCLRNGHGRSHGGPEIVGIGT